MKKSLIIAGIAIIIIALLLFGFGLAPYIPELPSRLAGYHNHGEIAFFVDGNQVTLDHCPIEMYTESGELLETTEIKNNSFRFKTGIYGYNSFCFEVLGVEVEFGDFNTNWRHVSYYDIELHLITNGDGTIDSAVLRQKKKIGSTGAESETESEVTFNGENKKIMVGA